MRYMTLVKAPETTSPPPQPFLEALGRLAQEATRAGVLLEMGGLAPTAASTAVRVAKGTVTVTDGPFAEAKEVVGGYGVYDVSSQEEAVEWTRRFAAIHVEHFPGWEGEIEIRPVFGPGDGPQPG